MDQVKMDDVCMFILCGNAWFHSCTIYKMVCSVKRKTCKWLNNYALMALIMSQCFLLSYLGLQFWFLFMFYVVPHLSSKFIVLSIYKLMYSIIWDVCNNTISWSECNLACMILMLFFSLLGYNPHCILFLGITTNGPRRSWRRWYLLNVETKRDATARHPSSHLVFDMIAFSGICIIEPLYYILHLLISFLGAKLLYPDPSIFLC